MAIKLGVNVSENTQKPTSCARSFGSCLMRYDSFGETFKLKLDKGQVMLPSIIGTVLSFISFFLIIGFTIQKLEILVNYKDMKITTSVQDNHFTESDTFSGRQGLNIAVALTSFDEDREMVSPEYAKIQFVYDYWDLTESGDVVYSDYIIESHACSEEELGLTGDNSKFMPIQDTSKNFVNVYKKKFQCIDQDDLEIYGNFST